MKRREVVPGYELLERISTGPTADVFLARSAACGVNRLCTVKCVPTYRERERAFVKSFLAEARLAAVLRHPNIAQVLEVGSVGAAYFVSMEHVPGHTLREILARVQRMRQPLPVPFVLAILVGVAGGLHHAHTRIGADGRNLRILHRNLTPDRIVVTHEGGVKVLDFELAKPPASEDTEAGTIRREVGYLSPEQVRGRRLDPRSDLFSLGIVAWELLTGERLYGAGGDFAKLHAIVTEAAPLPSTRRAAVPPEVDEVVSQLLAKDASARFQRADLLAEAIDRIAVASGMLITASAISGFMSELFATRPELSRMLPLPPPPDDVASHDVRSQPLAWPESSNSRFEYQAITIEVGPDVPPQPETGVAEPVLEAAPRKARIVIAAAALGAVALVALALVCARHRSGEDLARPNTTTSSDARVASKIDDRHGMRLRSCLEHVDDPEACTLAACRAGDIDRARAFFRQVDRKARRDIVSRCLVNDVPLHGDKRRSMRATARD